MEPRTGTSCLHLHQEPPGNHKQRLGTGRSESELGRGEPDALCVPRKAESHNSSDENQSPAEMALLEVFS